MECGSLNNDLEAIGAKATRNYPARYYYADYADIRDSRLTGTVTIADSHGEIVPSGGAVDFKSGTLNPGWRDRIAKRVDASSAYTKGLVY
jgi:hypothetical protein